MKRNKRIDSLICSQFFWIILLIIIILTRDMITHMRLFDLMIIFTFMVVYLAEDIVIIKNISLDKSIINQKKVMKICLSTIFLIGVNKLIWLPLIKRDKDFVEAEEWHKAKYFSISVVKITALIITLFPLSVSIYFLISDGDWLYYFIFFIVIVSIHLIFDIIIMIIVSRGKNFSNKKKVLKIMGSTIILLSITSLIWPFFLKDENIKTNEYLQEEKPLKNKD